jgi:2,4-didehydro-3-deoxy-L-rhamnonate hydrolase
VKLFRFGPVGAEKPGVILSDGSQKDISRFGMDFNEQFFSDKNMHGLREWLRLNADNCPDIPTGSRLGPCIARPSKIVCVGLNYAQHAAESGMEAPKEPVLFFKSTTAICGPNDPLIIPKGSEKTDWEVELAVIIGQKASYVPIEKAMEHVAGYCVHNDYSERAFQLERSGQWVKGKSCDSFAPIGPWLVTADEIPNPNNLRLWLTVNGQIMQDSSTSDFIFNVPFVVSYISQFMTLLPGDLISTGTPQGVGLGQKPPRYIVPGDKMKLGIEGLGEQEQIAQAYHA